MIDVLVGKDVEFTSVALLLLNLSVSFLPLAIPLSAFFATIFTLNRFSEDSEIIAMRSFGLTKFKLYTPFLVVSLVIGFGIFGLYRSFIPRANGEFKNTVLRLTSTGMLNSIKPGQFFTDIPGVTLFTDEVSNEGKAFKNVYIYVKNRNSSNEKIIMAKSGALLKIAEDKWSVPIIRLNLIDGNIVNWDKEKNQIQKVLFEEYDFPVLSKQMGSSTTDKDSMKTFKELEEIISNKKENFFKATTNDEKKDAKISLYKTQLEYYSRFLTSFQICLFIFVGFSLGIKKRRGPVSNNTSIGFLIVIFYYALYFSFVSLTNKGKIFPEITVVVPLVIIFLLGFIFYRKLDWAS